MHLDIRFRFSVEFTREEFQDLMRMLQQSKVPEGYTMRIKLMELRARYLEHAAQQAASQLDATKGGSK